MCDTSALVPRSRVIEYGSEFGWDVVGMAETGASAHTAFGDAVCFMGMGIRVSPQLRYELRAGTYV